MASDGDVDSSVDFHKETNVGNRSEERDYSRKNNLKTSVVHP
jgi:hypothetical protein